eukprot:6754112-Alexandrium_andersonii.AAC.1
MARVDRGRSCQSGSGHGWSGPDHVRAGVGRGAVRPAGPGRIQGGVGSLESEAGHVERPEQAGGVARGIRCFAAAVALVL